MKIGAHVGMWKSSLKDAIKDISTAELDGVEVFVFESLENPLETRKLLKNFQVDLSGMYHFGSDFINPKNAKAEIEMGKKILQFLRKVDGDFLILNSGNMKKPEGYPSSTYQKVAEAMNNIGKIGLETGVGVACHPHVGTMVETKPQLDLLMKYLDPDLVGLCLHAAHFIHTNTDPYNIYKEYADRVNYLHISDMTGSEKTAEANKLINQGEKNENVYKKLNIRPVDLGEGDIRQKELMTSLLKAGFDGWVIIEGKDPTSTPLKAIKKAKEYMIKEF